MRLSKNFKKKIKKLIIELTAIIICLAIIAVSIFALSKRKEKSESQTISNTDNITEATIEENINTDENSEEVIEPPKIENENSNMTEEDRDKIIQKEEQQAEKEETKPKTETKITQTQNKKTPEQESVTEKNRARTDKIYTTNNDTPKFEVISESYSEGKEINENQAKQLAIDQFEKLNDKISLQDLKVYTLNREGSMSFYIVSKKNTVEINKSDGKITRVNNKTLDDLRKDKKIS